MNNNKFIYITFLLIASIIMAGCASFLQTKKPNNFYYTENLYNSIKTSKSYKCTILSTNFYKEYTVSKDDKSIIENFFKNLHKENFTTKPKGLQNKPQYKIYFTFEKDKYVLDIYNENYIRIYPWDGNYEVDFIKTTDIPAKYNLYSLCTYIFKRQ